MKNKRKDPNHSKAKKALRKLSIFESILLGLGGLAFTLSTVGFLGIGQVIPWAAISIGSVFSKIAMYAPSLFLLSASMFIISGFGTSFKHYFCTMLLAIGVSMFSLQFWQPLGSALGLASPILPIVMLSILPALLILGIDMIVRMCLRNADLSVVKSLAAEQGHHVQTHMFAPGTEQTFSQIAYEAFQDTPDADQSQFSAM